MAYHKSDGIGKNALLLLGGVLTGAAIAMLYAPQSGKRTRRDLSLFARRTDRKTRRMIGDFSDAVSDMVDTLGEKATDILETGKDLAIDVRKDLMSAIEEGQEKLRRQRERLEKLVA
jgi:gas vesicle protein